MDNRVLLSFPSLAELKCLIEKEREAPGTTDWEAVVERLPGDYYLLKSAVFIAAYYQEKSLLLKLSDRFLNVPFLQGSHVVEFLTLELPDAEKASLLKKNGWLNKPLKIGGEEGLHVTPLVVSVKQSRYGLMIALIEAGADPFAPVLRSEGESTTLLDEAYECGFQLAFEYLYALGVPASNVEDLSLNYSMTPTQKELAVSSPDALANTWDYVLDIYRNLPLSGISKFSAIMQTLAEKERRTAILETLFNPHLFLSGMFDVSVETQLRFWNDALHHPVCFSTIKDVCLSNENGVPTFNTNSTLGLFLQIHVCCMVMEKTSDPSIKLSARNVLKNTLKKIQFKQEDIDILPDFYRAATYQSIDFIENSMYHNKKELMTLRKGINTLRAALQESLLKNNTLKENQNA